MVEESTKRVDWPWMWGFWLSKSPVLGLEVQLSPSAGVMCYPIMNSGQAVGIIGLLGS